MAEVVKSEPAGSPCRDVDDGVPLVVEHGSLLGSLPVRPPSRLVIPGLVWGFAAHGVAESSARRNGASGTVRRLRARLRCGSACHRVAHRRLRGQ